MLTCLGRTIRLVSFDLDDTLVETFGSIPARIRAAIRDAPLPVVPDDDRIVAIIRAVLDGDPSARPARLVAEIGLTQGDPLAGRLIRAYSTDTASIEAVAGAREVLEALSTQVRIAVVTNGGNGGYARQAAKLERHGFDRLVDVVMVPWAPETRKPGPAMFQRLCELTGVPATEAVHVGDSLATDVAGANAAGFGSVLYRGSAPEEDADPAPLPDATIGHLRALLSLLGPP